MYYYKWNEEKNKQLKKERKISFEEIVNYITNDRVIDIVDNPSSNLIIKNAILLISIIMLGLFLLSKKKKERFLKTAFQSRKHKKFILLSKGFIMSNDLNYKLDEEELKILEDIENGNYVSLKETNSKEFKKEMVIAKIAAKNTIERLTKKKNLYYEVNENDVESIKGIALEKGLPYQTFIASIIHQIATKQIKV